MEYEAWHDLSCFVCDQEDKDLTDEGILVKYEQRIERVLKPSSLKVAEHYGVISPVFAPAYVERRLHPYSTEGVLGVCLRLEGKKAKA